MSVGNKKTKTFKATQCRLCKLSSKGKKGKPSCPRPNPRIVNGQCLDREPTDKVKQNKG